MAKHSVGEWWSEGKQLEVVTAYLILGKSNLVESLTGVPRGTIRRWKSAPWWKELVDQIQTEEDQELDAKLTKVVNKVLTVVDDRLDNGDFQYDPRTGEFVRKPVGLRDSWKAGKEMIDLRQNLRKAPKERVDQAAVQDILKNPAVEFAQMAKRKATEKIIEGEVIYASGSQESVGEVGTGVIRSELQVGVRELPRETGTDSQSLGS